MKWSDQSSSDGSQWPILIILSADVLRGLSADTIPVKLVGIDNHNVGDTRSEQGSLSRVNR